MGRNSSISFIFLIFSIGWSWKKPGLCCRSFGTHCAPAAAHSSGNLIPRLTYQAVENVLIGRPNPQRHCTIVIGVSFIADFIWGEKDENPATLGASSSRPRSCISPIRGAVHVSFGPGAVLSHFARRGLHFIFSSS